jgi:hypothetical protein
MTMAIGRSVQRKESREKVTGRALYAADLPMRGVLSARLLISPCAHARIESIDISGRWRRNWSPRSGFRPTCAAAQVINRSEAPSSRCLNRRRAVKQMFE